MNAIISKNKILTITLSLILLTSSISIPFQPNEAAAISFNNPIEIPNPNPSSSSEFGHVLDEANDNIIAGVPKSQVLSSPDEGRAYLFSGVTGGLLLTIDPPTPVAGLNFGESVAGIGTTSLVAIGAPGANSGDGAVYIYDTATCDDDTSGGGILGDNKCEVPTLTIDNPNPDSGAEGARMGADKIVAINNNEILIGVSLSNFPGSTDSGVVYRYNVSTDTLVQTYNAGAGIEAFGYFGKSLSVFDSTRFITGAYGSDVVGSGSSTIERGKAFVVDFSGTILHTFNNPNSLSTNVNDRFGWSVTTLPDTYVVSSLFGDIAEVDNGFVRYFNSAFAPTTGIGLGLEEGDEHYGFWLDAADGLILIGAPKVDIEDFESFPFVIRTDSGFISLTDNQGNEQAFFFNPNDFVDMENDLFGFSHAIIDRTGENNLAIGAPGDGAGVVWYIIEDTAVPVTSAQLDITTDDPEGDDIVFQAQLIEYTYTLTNTGTTNLQTFSVSSDCSGGTAMTPNLPGPILPLETRTFTCTAMPPAGSTHTETTNVSVDDGSNTFTCSDPQEVTCNDLTLTISQPSMTLSGVAVPPTVPSGGTSDVTFTVTNTGNVDLDTSILISPSLCTVAPPSQIISPGLSGLFDCEVTGITSTTIITGTPSGDDPTALPPISSTPPSLPVTITVGSASMTLDSVPEDNPVGPSGSTDVDFTVTNTGSFALTNVQVVTDAASQGLTCSITPSSLNIPIGGTGVFTCTVSGIVGDVTLTSTATADETGPITDTIDFELAAPAILIQNEIQTPNPGPPLSGGISPVNLSWEIINTGNIPVTFPVTDIDASGNGCSSGPPVGPAPGEDANSNNLLDMGETFTYSCDHDYTQIGNLDETINASSFDEFNQVATDSKDIVVVIDDPQISLDITSDPVIPAPNSSVELFFTITNTGNVEVDGLFISGLNLGGASGTCDPTFPVILSLLVGESATASCIVTAPSDDFTVTATGEATGVIHGVQITDTASITIIVEEPVSDITITSIIRDFSEEHPDMQQGCSGVICNGVKPGLVQEDIGLDSKPIFNQDIDSTNGPVNFNQWYNHIPTVNQCTDYDMVLEFDDQTNTYSFLNGGISGGFFPIDGLLIGNEGFSHNYHFTLQGKATFDHQPGQFFTIGGADDDVFVFINGKLAIDLGGLHPQTQASATIDLDDPLTQAKLGISPGDLDIDFDIFFAERQTTGSHLDISTNIELVPLSLGQCDVLSNAADLSIEKIGELISGGTGIITVEKKVSTSSDDAEEDDDGDMDLNSSDLDMNEKEFVGLRFNGINIPQDATITNAYVQFTVEDENGDTGKAGVKIFGEDIGDAPTFTSSDDDISDRDKTSSYVKWDIPDWHTQGQSGPDQATPDLSDIIQEIVSRNDWTSGNSIALIIEEDKGNRDRDAISWDNDPLQAPVLIIEYDGGVTENEIVYTITITNNGPDDATFVEVLDNLPEEVTATSVEPIPQCAIIDVHTVECDFASLDVGEEEIITIIGTIEQGTIGTITNIASVLSGLLDPNPTNDQATEETTIGGGGELFCGKPEDSYNRIDGTNSKETIVGTHGDDLIFGYGGNDRIVGLKGDDCIFGGEGNDKINGNQGDDEIHGGEGKDRLRGNHGNDTIFGDDNDDRLYGGHGDDYLDGGSHDKYDRCVGGSGVDTGVNCEKQTGIEN